MRLQSVLAASERWIMDGDPGPHDAPGPRLERADTVVILDFSLARCAWGAAHRSREHIDFWWWLLTWRLRRDVIVDAVATFAVSANMHLLRTPTELRDDPEGGKTSND